MHEIFDPFSWHFPLDKETIPMYYNNYRYICFRYIRERYNYIPTSVYRRLYEEG
jgi:hypothetical protein